MVKVDFEKAYHCASWDFSEVYVEDDGLWFQVGMVD